MLRLFFLGVWESLQLQRCVVLFVLDDRLWAKALHCLLLNGCVFLGSLAWWMLALQPLMHWLLATKVAPRSGHQLAACIEAALHGLYHVSWLMPVYVVTLAVSCSWYNEMAAIALEASQKHSATLKRQSPSSGQRAGESVDGAGSAIQSIALPALKPSAKSASAGFEVVAAQELFRVVLFLVYYGETWVLGQLPYVGPPLYFLCSSWLCAYYCYDYAWALRGVSLPDRLAFFECSAAFFAGYGFLMTLTTVLLPFYVGAAVTAILFPLFVLVACQSDPPALIAAALNLHHSPQNPPSQPPLHQHHHQHHHQHQYHLQQQQQQQLLQQKQQALSSGPPQAAEPRWPGTWRVPIFALALRPTRWLLHRMLRTLPGSTSSGKSS